MEFCYVRLWENVTAEKQPPCFPAYQLGVEIILCATGGDGASIDRGIGWENPICRKAIISSWKLYPNFSLGVETILENRSWWNNSCFMWWLCSSSWQLFLVVFYFFFWGGFFQCHTRFWEGVEEELRVYFGCALPQNCRWMVLMGSCRMELWMRTWPRPASSWQSSTLRRMRRTLTTPRISLCTPAGQNSRGKEALGTDLYTSGAATSILELLGE